MCVLKRFVARKLRSVNDCLRLVKQKPHVAGAMPNHGAVNPNMPAGTHNSEGINIDLYIPRKW